jgi:hypothetical protein
MNEQHLQKPNVEEWLFLAVAVVDRLTECVHVYKHPPFVDVFVADAERQHKSNLTVGLIRRFHTLLDQAETPTDSIAGAYGHDERVIDGFIVLFHEALKILPWLSADMQKLLKSPWMRQFPNKIAETLFLGDGDETQGIGSGHPEHGRLPAALAAILEREQIGETRHPREELLRHGEPRRHDVEGRTRWVRENSSFLRTAGRVE